MAKHVTVGWIEPGRPDVDNLETCAQCGFDSVVTVPMVILKTTGVQSLRSIKVCTRCVERYLHP